MSDAQTSRVGTMFGPYHLKRLLGRGGMGEVYEAEHTVKEWTVAVKLMSDQFSSDPVFRERMKREARIAGRLQEPHVVPIHDYGEIDGKMFLEMRLIEGIDLESVLKRFGPLTPPRAVAIISQIASALDAAHAAGVMHRDVKPPNILITRDDFAYLVDFGIASATTDEKLTQLGTAVGTWKYMAPERFSDGEVTYRADIYALACVLYECLTGAPPYRADSAGTLVNSHMRDAIPQASAARSGIPKSLDGVIARGMAKQPEDRYASAGDLASAAAEALSDPDQDRAADILRRSQEAALPDSSTPTPAPPPTPTLAATEMAPPQPYPGPPSWAPSSGPAPTPPYYQGNSGSWGGQPPGGPPPPQFGGQPWSQAPPPRKRNRWPIIAGLATLLVVIILAAIDISMVMSDRDKHKAEPATTTRTASTTTSTPADEPPQSKLLRFLPGGYPTGTCTPTTPKPDTIWANAVAMVDCEQNTKQGGPSHAVYGLFSDPDALKKAFTDDISAVQLENCPGGGPSPDDWHYDKTPTVTAGSIACGTYKDHTNLIWSHQSKLMLSDVFGDPPGMEDLHTWWAKYG